jgi:hypothetical protein
LILSSCGRLVGHGVLMGGILDGLWSPLRLASRRVSILVGRLLLPQATGSATMSTPYSATAARAGALLAAAALNV